MGELVSYRLEPSHDQVGGCRDDELHGGRDILGWPSRRARLTIRLIYNGVDIVQFQPLCRPSRIVFLLPTLDIGGAERVVLRTVAGLDRTRFDPVVVAFARGSGRLAAELNTAGVPVTALRASSDFTPLMIWRLWRWLGQHSFDVLMTFMFHANVAGRVMRMLGRVPAVVCSERAVWREPGWRLAVNRLTAGCADVITTNSREGVRVWAHRLGVSEASIRVIYNGVDVERFPVRRRSDDPEVIIGSLGRFHPLKGQDLLLDALARLAVRPNMPPWRCRLAGDGPDLSRLRERSAALGLVDRVSFLGHVHGPERFLSEIDLFVNSSSTEGMPNAVLEAMACGLPIVATAVGGTPEVVEDGITGLLVPFADPDRLCEAMASLLGHPGRRLTMGQAGRARVERFFSTNQMIRETERLLDEVIGRQPTPGKA